MTRLRKEVNSRYTKTGLKKILDKRKIDYSKDFSKEQLLDLIFSKLDGKDIEEFLEIKRQKTVWTRTISVLGGIALILGLIADGEFAITKLGDRFNSKQSQESVEIGKQEFALSDSSKLKILILQFNPKDGCKSAESYENRIIEYINDYLDGHLLLDHEIILRKHNNSNISVDELYTLGLNSLANIIIKGELDFDCNGKNDSIRMVLRVIPYSQQLSNSKGENLSVKAGHDITSGILDSFIFCQNKIFSDDIHSIEPFKGNYNSFLFKDSYKHIDDYLKSVINFLNIKVFYKENKYGYLMYPSRSIVFSSSRGDSLFRTSTLCKIIANIENITSRNDYADTLLKYNTKPALFLYQSLLESAIKHSIEYEQEYYESIISSRYPCFNYYDLVHQLDINPYSETIKTYFKDPSKLECFNKDSILYYQENCIYRRGHEKEFDCKIYFLKVQDIYYSSMFMKCFNLHNKERFRSCLTCLDTLYAQNEKHNISYSNSMTGLSYYIYSEACFKLGKKRLGMKYLALASEISLDLLSEEERELVGKRY